MAVQPDFEEIYFVQGGDAKAAVSFPAFFRMENSLRHAAENANKRAIPSRRERNKRGYMDIRKAQRNDLAPLLELYTQLHGNAMPRFDKKLETLWNGILADKNHSIVVGVLDGMIVSSCVLVVVPNLTHSQRPYAVVENVVTHEAYRNRGYASQLLRFAKEIAVEQECYKIMLMTSSRMESTWRFYEQAGYNRTDKTAFIQWLD